MDYESDSTYELTIRTTDPTELYFDTILTINITNVVEDPFATFAYDTAHRNDSINENYTGFIGIRSPLIFDQSTTMKDFTITDSLLVPVEFENFFTYRGDSLFLNDSTLDHEISNHRNIDIQMRLRDDVNGNSILITVTTLRLRNVNEFPPTNLRWVGGNAQRRYDPPSERLKDNTRVGYPIRNEQGNKEPIYLEVQDKDDYGPTAYSHTRHTFSIFSGNDEGFF